MTLVRIQFSSYGFRFIEGYRSTLPAVGPAQVITCQEKLTMPRLTHRQMEQFEREGYLLVKKVLDVEHIINPIIREYHEVLNRLANELYEAKEIRELYEELSFGDRITRIYAETGKIHAQYFDFSLPQAGSIEPDTPFWAGPAVFRAITDPDLLDYVECFIGPEIYSNPVQHVRIKPPERLVPRTEDGQPMLGATSWHQDNGVVRPESDKTNMLTVWFPLTSAREEHGCLQVVPGSLLDGLTTHCPGGTGGLRIPDQIFDKSSCIPIPMEAGDVLFFHKLIVHGSLSNKSNEVRWSFDLRYNPIGQETGRGAFPGFVARSRTHPEGVLRNPAEWEQSWRNARDRLAVDPDPGPFNRWNLNHPACA